MADPNGTENAAIQMDEVTDATSCAELSEGEPQCPDKDNGKETEGKRHEQVMSTKRIMKNIIVISLVFLMNFTAFNGLSKVQSSLYRDDGLGVTCQAVLYGTMCLACLFLPKFAISFLGHKWCMTWSLWGYILWVAANGYAVWATMIPASIILGITAATLWTSQCSYFTIVANEYALQARENRDAVLTRFFGIFFCIFQFSTITGLVIFSAVFTLAPDANEDPSDEELALCGQNDCPWTNHNSSYYEEPVDSKVWTLIGIYTAIGVTGFFICAFFVDNMPYELDTIVEKDSVMKVMATDFVATIKHMRHNEMLLLMTITLYSSLQWTYFMAEWNNSYVTCAIGIRMVGWTVICSTVVNATTSYCSGHLVKKTGRIAIFTFGLIVDVCFICLLLFWAPRPDDLWLFFFIPCLCGISGGIWQTQIHSFYGVLFPRDSEAAFSNHRFWSSIGYTIAFSYSALLCTDIKLYILIGVLAVGFTGYAVVEVYLYSKGEISNPIKRTTVGYESLNDE